MSALRRGNHAREIRRTHRPGDQRLATNQPTLAYCRSIPKRPLPHPTPETPDFWDGAKASELRIQRCDDCKQAYFPPRPFCPACASRAVASFRATGRGRLYSYVINHRPAPGFED